MPRIFAPLLTLAVASAALAAPPGRTLPGARESRPAPRTTYTPPRTVGLAEYRRQALANPDLELVDVEKIVPGIQLDLRYATNNNFMGRRLYGAARALLRRPVAERLCLVQADLARRGLGLRIFDTYRPYSVTVDMWRSRKAKAIYVSPPSIGSRHNRGVAVDLTLCDLKTGKPLPMPSDFDEFSPRASHGFTGTDAARIANRKLLRDAMRAHGFFSFENEWWHYSYGDWRGFDILDIPVEAVP